MNACPEGSANWKCYFFMVRLKMVDDLSESDSDCGAAQRCHDLFLRELFPSRIQQLPERILGLSARACVCHQNYRTDE